MFKFLKFQQALNPPLIVNFLSISTPQVANNPTPRSTLKRIGKYTFGTKKDVSFIESKIDIGRSNKIPKRSRKRLKMEMFRTPSKKENIVSFESMKT